MFLARIPTITRGSSPISPVASSWISGGSVPEAPLSGSAEHWSVEVRKRTAQTVRILGALEIMAMAIEERRLVTGYLKEILQEEVFVCLDISIIYSPLSPPALLLHNGQKEEVPELISEGGVAGLGAWRDDRGRDKR